MSSSGYSFSTLTDDPYKRNYHYRQVWIVQQEFSGLIIGVASNKEWANTLASIYKEAGADKDNYLVREFRVTSDSLSIPPSFLP